MMASLAIKFHVFFAKYQFLGILECLFICYLCGMKLWLMTRIKHQIQPGHGFPTYQTHRLKEERCVFFVTETEQCSLLLNSILHADAER
ncbi:hypothetical protein C7120_07200 [Prevotella sp. oral taxon 376]|nr:hypothetical protein C7120_07200 [Prevotella sp. oral taxon 376]